MTEYKYIQYETVDDGRIARIILNRPKARNAQHRGLLVELHDAFLAAEADDDGAGGHPERCRPDLLGGTRHGLSRNRWPSARRAPTCTRPSRSTAPPGRARSRRMLGEWHYFFQNTLRWRNLRKITIAQVQGTVFAAGLMLMWACDLIVAADDVSFADVVGTRLGMCGVEYFAHPWEFGPRKTKELMLTGDSLSAEEAHALGMVSKVFPLDELEERTLEFARRIAALPTMTALLIKESVNQTVDNMGFYNALQSCFTLHQLNHAHWAEIHENHYPIGLPEDGLADWRSAPPVVPAVMDQVRAPDVGRRAGTTDLPGSSQPSENGTSRVCRWRAVVEERDHDDARSRRHQALN